ncbi:BON domain-containing protein [Nitrosomonas sp. Nm34]|uniref:BON domain-containing protein n=1 Tax=Nitrosomonas sp. Nm34 TaxID=1881055 RepID=UPI0008EEA741|nr:BON domain-containing protein [Nitrosomonas sp. Nm34]SFI76354.1 BON domain-containing protein [Nitrosomonas sp. Nm34]
MEHINNRFSIFLLIVLIAFFLGGAPISMAKETAEEYIDDSVITAMVKKAIYDEPTLKTSEIKVKTSKGLVKLSGFVNSQAEIDKAGEIALFVNGVQSVKNDLRIK